MRLVQVPLTYRGNTSYFDDDGNGNLRIYYIAGSNTRVYTNETAGVVNYRTGLVTINAFLPSAFVGSSLSIFADSADDDVNAIRNQILLIAGANVTLIDDATTLVAATTVTATTSGVTTEIPGSNPPALVY